MRGSLPLALFALLTAGAAPGAGGRAGDDAPLTDVSPEDLLNKLPHWMRPCPRKDPNADGCLRNTFERMFPALANGIPEVALPPFEPLRIPRLTLKRGHGAVTIVGSFRDVLARGPSNSTVEYFRLNLESRYMEFGLHFPELDLEAEYDLRGQILVLPLVGAGRARLHLRNMTTTTRAKVQLRRVGEREVLHATGLKMTFAVETLSVHLDNLFGGNKVLGATLNAFLNQHAQTVVADMAEPVGEALGEVFVDLINRLLHRVPIDLWLV